MKAFFRINSHSHHSLVETLIEFVVQAKIEGNPLLTKPICKTLQIFFQSGIANFDQAQLRKAVLSD